MILSGKNILLISPEPWDHIFVSKHHYAIHLAKRGNRVYFLNLSKGATNISPSIENGVNVIASPPIIRGIKFFPRIFQRQSMKWQFRHIEKLAQVNFDIIWSFDNSVLFDFSAFPTRILKVCHIVDLNQNFQFQRAAKTADLCICTTDFILERMRLYQENVFKINHGYSPLESIQSQLRLPGKSLIKTVYSGNLSMPYIDWILIDKLIEENHSIDFVFIGPNQNSYNQVADQNDAKKRALKRTNVYLTGRLGSKELNQYLTLADILLVAYQEKYHKDQANPHKIMEYLGTGKVVLATNTIEYESLVEEKLIVMSKKNDELRGLFKKAIITLSDWNSTFLQKSRIEFALQNTYDRQINRIQDIIGKVRL